MKEEQKENILYATSVAGHTLLGVSGSFPLDYGNCFTVHASDGETYKIVNFVLENLEKLSELGVGFPFKMRIIRGRVAVINDERIPDDWYQGKFCETCCPVDLLPITQQLRRERHIACGAIEEHNGFTTWNASKLPRIKV